uniref:Uncharacterized protein n=1 Tax=Lepeophtheirus salmonis TaxID=72036 RepID=A0A0K2T634_LEPSM
MVTKVNRNTRLCHKRASKSITITISSLPIRVPLLYSIDYNFKISQPCPTACTVPQTENYGKPRIHECITLYFY